MKPALRHSTTRAQPTPGSHVNTVGDFHYHNNIEDIDHSPESSVQVDDFYYDYNFINFHEDLSDDFESDGNGAEGVFGTPQDAEPPQRAPNVTVETLETEETAHANPDPTEDNGNAENSEGSDDFLSEDYLLPVPTTRSPPVRHSQTQQKRNNRLGVQAKDVNGPEVEKGFNVTADSLPDDVDVSATNPGYQTTISGTPGTPTSTPEGNGRDYVYSFYKESTLIPENQERFQSVQLEESVSEIPRTPSQSFVVPSGFRLEGLDPDHTDFRTYAPGGYSRDTDLNPTSASFSAFENSTPTSLPFLQTSVSQHASVISTSSGTGTEPLADLEGATQTTPADLLPAARKYDPTEPLFTERGGAESSPQAPWFDVAAPDETVTPITARSGGSQLPPGTTAGPEQITTEAPHQDPPASTHSAVLWPLLLPTSIQTTASPQVTFPGYWIAGNWSAVSPSVTRNHRFSQNYFAF